MDATERLSVSVAFALPERQEVVALEVEPGTSVAEAVRRSGLQERFPEWDLGGLPVGVHGEEVPGGRLVEHGDRVEIYRPLQMDPREARRRRAAGDRLDR